MSNIDNSQNVVTKTVNVLINTLDHGTMDKNISKEFNTYRNWNEFDLQLDDMPDENYYDALQVNVKGIKSLFNNVNAIISDRSQDAGNPYRNLNNMPLMDTPEKRIMIRDHTKCTIKDLVDNSAKGIMGRQIYDYSDFAYCTYLGRIPNNYLITLRRFPVPCGDHIDFNVPNDEREKFTQNHLPDIGRMVTWIGTPGNEMNNILKYTVGMKWTVKTSDFQTVGGNADNSSPLAQMFNAADPTYQKQVVRGYAGSGQTFLSNFGYFGAPFIQKHAARGITKPQYKGTESFRDSNKVYGPLDVMQRVNMRDRGIEVNHDITLTFDYKLRSYDGINGKAAMLDLLSNILAVTYTTGKFWGGAYRRSSAAHQSSLFTNLPIFKAANTGSASAVIDSFSDSISYIGSQLKQQYGGDNLLETAKNFFTSMLKGVGSMLLGGMLNKLGRPAKLQANSLLVNAPTGMWHLTVGNPMAPIITVGNLCLENAEIEHYGPLGIDDFPIGLKVTVKLKPGMDRDASGIEKMYLRGDTRYYIPVDKKILNMYNEAKQIKGEQNNITITTVGATSDVTDNPTNKEVQDLETISVPENTKNILMKTFGTTNINNIVIASREAFLGSVDDTKTKK